LPAENYNKLYGMNEWRSPEPNRQFLRNQGGTDSPATVVCCLFRSFDKYIDWIRQDYQNYHEAGRTFSNSSLRPRPLVRWFRRELSERSI
jgi:hypothetical protein